MADHTTRKLDTRSETTLRVMAAVLTILTQNMVIIYPLVAESCTTCRLGLCDEFGNFWVGFHVVFFSFLFFFSFQESERVKYFGVQRKCVVQH